MHSVLAIAHPNIALIKYWGKRDRGLNLPAAGSLSITLDELRTRTRVTVDPGLDEDQFTLDGAAPDEHQARRVAACLDRLRALADSNVRLRVESDNNFPTGAGLASSASGFAALVTATAAALDLDLSHARLSEQARLGSGSAARSIHGGFVEMMAGRREDGSDCVAVPLAAADQWPLKVVIAITSRDRKPHGSSEGMERSRRTSPFYRQWVDSTTQDLDLARGAVTDRDFEALAAVAEHSCLKMHATMMTSRPPLIYWNAATVAAMHEIRALRSSGVPVFLTIDAGPQLKAVCEPASAETVAGALAGVPGVQRVLSVGLGGPARSMKP